MSEEIILAEMVRRDLGTDIIGREVYYYPSLVSTMITAGELARQWVAEGAAVIADIQTGGRGRLKRSWLTPAGNLAVSVVLRPPIAVLPSLIMLASLAAVRCIRSVTGVDACIKWPNDVQIKGKKVCGILIESTFNGSRADYSIIGIGIDVNMKVADFPEIKEIATSLYEETGKYVSRLAVLRSLLVEMDKIYRELCSGGSVFEAWRDDLVTLGEKVKVTERETVNEGIAESVDRDGSLMLRQSDGSLLKIVAGDVTLRD